MGKKSLGCLGIVLVLFALGGWFFTQTEAGMWIGGIILVYGGVIVGSAFMFATDEATITRVEAKDDKFFNGSLWYEWEGPDGEMRQGREQVLGRPGALDGYEVGDSIAILVCRADPEIVYVAKFQSYSGKECLEASGVES